MSHHFVGHGLPRAGLHFAHPRIAPVKPEHFLDRRHLVVPAFARKKVSSFRQLRLVGEQLVLDDVVPVFIAPMCNKTAGRSDVTGAPFSRHQSIQRARSWPGRLS